MIELNETVYKSTVSIAFSIIILYLKHQNFENSASFDHKIGSGQYYQQTIEILQWISTNIQYDAVQLLSIHYLAIASFNEMLTINNNIPKLDYPSASTMHLDTSIHLIIDKLKSVKQLEVAAAVTGLVLFANNLSNLSHISKVLHF